MESAEHEGIQNHDQQIYAVVAIFCFVSFMAICMRLMAKYLKAQMIDLGDYLAIFSWVAQPLQAVGILLNRPQIVTFAEGILVAEGPTTGGLGRHIRDIPEDKIVRFLKGFWVLPILETTALATAKLSMLFVLHRIFVTRRFRATVIVLAVIVACWWIGFTCGHMFICDPIHSNWDNETPHHCGNQRVLFLTGPIPWVLTDFAILIAPMFVIKGLQLRLSEKIGLCAFFSAGGITCIIACYHFKTLFDISIDDPTWSGASASVWSVTETNVTIVCICLVTIRPTLQYLFPATIVNFTRKSWSKLVSSERWSRLLSSRRSLNLSSDNSNSPSGLGKEKYGGRVKASDVVEWERACAPHLPSLNDSIKDGRGLMTHGRWTPVWDRMDEEGGFEGRY